MKWTDPDVRVLVRLTIAFLALTGFYVIHRVEMLDEGWYLYAGKLAWRGELPYRDFAYFQAPLLPYLYGVSQKLLPPGLLSGRLVAAAFAAATWLLTLSVARRLGGARAAIIAACAFLSSIYLYSHFPIVLTYAPAAFFLMAAVDASLRGQIFRTVVFAVIAAGIRISLAPAVPILAAGVFLASPRSRADAMRLAAGLALGAALALFFLLPDPELALYDLVGYHVARRSLVERLHTAGASAAETLATTSMLLVPALVAPRFASGTRLVKTLTALLIAVLLANLVPATAAPSTTACSCRCSRCWPASRSRECVPRSSSRRSLRCTRWRSSSPRIASTSSAAHGATRPGPSRIDSPDSTRWAAICAPCPRPRRGSSRWGPTSPSTRIAT